MATARLWMSFRDRMAADLDMSSVQSWNIIACNFRESSKIVEDKLKEIGKLFQDKSRSVTLDQGTDNFAGGDFEVADVEEECNKYLIIFIN